MRQLGAWATGYSQQAPVTQWPVRIALVVIVVLLIAGALWGMRRGWVDRQRRQGWIPAPVDQPTGTDLEGPVPGLFLGTAMVGDWMDRVAVHDLGVRSRADLSWGSAGVWFDRVGARSVFVPAADVIGVRVDSGIAGTVKARDSVIVLTWRLGEAAIETGFRADGTGGHATVLEGLTSAFGAGVDRRGDR